MGTAQKIEVNQSEIRYLDEAEVAKLTGRKVQTLRNDRFKGKGIPYYKVGRSVRYRHSDVIDFMEGKRIEVRDV